MPDADWKATYLNSLRDMEEEEKRFRAIETALRRIVTRLCTAARGQDDDLDAQLSRIADANQRNAGATELEGLLTSLRDAVAAHDARAAASSRATTAHGGRQGTATVAAPVESPAQPAPSPATPPQAAVVPGRWSATLEAVARLLRELASDGPNDPAVDALIQELGHVETDEALAALLKRAAEIAHARGEALAHERSQAAALLTDVTARLDEVSQYILGSNDDRRTTLGDAEALNNRVLDQVQELNQEVQVARDLAPLKTLVGTRIEAIATQVREFRAREESRFLEHSERNQRMTSRVAELERQAKDLQRSLQHERRRARLDPLTGIPNRISFDERLAEEIQRWKRFRNPVCVLVWDIDRFKLINDNYGHRAGDRVLREVAKTFAGQLRTTDVIARFGGEEFVMLLIGTTLPDATRKADELRAKIADLKFHFRGEPIRVTVSCGITELRGDDEAESVFDRADKALYSAKDGGRNLCIAA